MPCSGTAWTCLLASLLRSSTSTQQPMLTSLHTCFVPEPQLTNLITPVCCHTYCVLVLPASRQNMPAFTLAVSQHCHMVAWTNTFVHLPCPGLPSCGLGMPALTPAFSLGSLGIPVYTLLACLHGVATLCPCYHVTAWALIQAATGRCDPNLERVFEF